MKTTQLSYLVNELKQHCSIGRIDLPGWIPSATQVLSKSFCNCWMARLRTGSSCSRARSPTHSPASMSSTKPVPTPPRSTGLKLYFLWKLVSLSTSRSSWWSLFWPSLKSSSSLRRGFSSSFCSTLGWWVFEISARSLRGVLLKRSSRKAELFSNSLEGLVDDEEEEQEEGEDEEDGEESLALLTDRGSSLKRISLSSECPCTPVTSFFGRKSVSKLL